MEEVQAKVPVRISNSERKAVLVMRAVVKTSLQQSAERPSLISHTVPESEPEKYSKEERLCNMRLGHIIPILAVHNHT